MRIGWPELQLPQARGARLVALRLLDDASTVVPRIKTEDDDALHDFRVAIRRLRSWLRAFDDELNDGVSRKVRRRLSKVAHATNPPRDLQVQVEWLGRVGGTARGERRAAAAWMVRFLTANAGDTRDTLHASVRKTFPKMRDALADVLADELPTAGPTASFAGSSTGPSLPTLATAIADRIGPHLLALHEALASVHRMRDESAAHDARIAAKRLRYLVEATRGDVAGAAPLVDQLRALQDALGALHDAHVLARVLRDTLAGAANFEAHRAGNRALGRALAPVGADDLDPYAGCGQGSIVSLMRRLRLEIRDTFARARQCYTGAAGQALNEAAAVLEQQLREGPLVAEASAPTP